MNFLKSFIAGLFSLFFGILLIITVCVFSISSFANKDNIVNNMKQTDILTEVKKIRNSGSSEGQSGVTQVIDEMYSLASQFSVSEDVVDKIIDSDVTKEIIGESVGNLTDYVINGKKTKVLSADDIYDLINNNLDDMLKSSDMTLDDGQKEKFLREIKKQLPDIVSVIPTSDELSNYSYELEQVQEIFSNETKVILCICLVISMVIVIVIKRKNFEWCINLGVALLISGLIIMGLALVVPEFITGMMGSIDLSLFVSSFTELSVKPILYSGALILVLAIILLVLYKVLNRKRISS